MSKVLTPDNKDQLDSLVRDALRDHEKVIGHYVNLVDFLVERLVKDITEWHNDIVDPNSLQISEDAEDEKFFQQTGDMIESRAKTDIDMSPTGFTIYDKDFKK